MAAIDMKLSNLKKAEERGFHRHRKVLVGIGVDMTGGADNDTDVFTIGKTDAAEYATAPTNAVTDWICYDLKCDPDTHHGRVFYYGFFEKYVAG